MWPQLRSTLNRLLDDEQGLETVEYAILTGLLAAGAIATIVSISMWVWFQFRQLYYNIEFQD